MNAYKRAQYLHALQIPEWTLRKDIEPVVNEVISDTQTIEESKVIETPSIEKAIAEPVKKPIEAIEKKLVEKEKPASKPSAIAETIPDYILDEPPLALDEHVPPPELGVDEFINDAQPEFQLQGYGKQDADCILLGNIAVVDEEEFAFAENENTLLTNMLKAIQLSQDEIFTVKPLSCLATLVRDPQDSELLACKNYLLAHIDKIQPKAILIMNQLVAEILLDTQQSLIQLSGKVHKLAASNTQVVVTFPPSHLLKKTSDKRKAWDDLKRLKQALNK